MPFAYYRRLSAAHKAIYRKSDGISRIEVPNLDAMRGLSLRIEQALIAAKRSDVEAAANDFAQALFDAFSVRRVRVYVRATRPSSDQSELHGLYTFADGDAPPKIEVWMRTAAHKQVVRFRTFLRTLAHEMLHHLDVTHFELGESFHTEGFYRRESSLMRQLLPERIMGAAKAKASAPPAKRRKKPSQLSLF
ncbi:MAG: hypothetical protein IPK60_00815 [Sandaracinaceae bacterium]|nr:hypothetical protein [Sandaracinaceae bacterium]